jgi:hypothetical protein
MSAMSSEVQRESQGLLIAEKRQLSWLAVAWEDLRLYHKD